MSDAGKLRVLGSSNNCKVLLGSVSCPELYRKSTCLREVDQFVKMGHKDRNLVSQASKKPINVAVDLGNIHVRVTILCSEGSEVILGQIGSTTDLVSLREQHSLR